jgi:superfamily II DNA or RNA helicase
MSQSEGLDKIFMFGAKEQLLLHQLRLCEWQDNRRQTDDSTKSDTSENLKTTLPHKWRLTQGVELYQWQDDCVEKWFENQFRGTAKVVTGGGKTLLALSIAERLQNTIQPDLRVAVVVPTIVLMHQWYDEIIEKGNLPKAAIGRLGGGYKDDFKGKHRILICVLASAQKELPKQVKKGKVGDKLLFIADECHRLGAKEMARVFNTERKYNLGLSATPERDDLENQLSGYDQSQLGQELGSIIYDFTLAKALELGVVPKFSINHFGLPLNADERNRYEALSRSISDNRKELTQLAPEGRSGGAAFFQWARGVAKVNKGNKGAVARKFIGDTSKRKELLYHIESRIMAVVELIRDEVESNPEARIILFHENIDAVMNLFLHLKAAGFSAIAEHSKLPNSVRETGLELFRKGIARIIVSARSLIEGFNVPAVDVGIIVASSSSVRQRVQSMGRVLRKHKSRTGEEKTSCIYVLYASDTVDEMIYSKQNWDDITGVDRNIYHLWTPGSTPAQQPNPPKVPLPTDKDIDTDNFSLGDEYPGEYDGDEFTCDTHGNIKDSDGNYATNPGELANLIIKVKGSAGRFKITRNKGFVLVIIPTNGEWSTKYVTTLKESMIFENPEAVATASLEKIDEWITNAKPGDEYPFLSIPTISDDIKFRLKRGGVISKKVPGGEVYARRSDRANDPAKGKDTDTVLKCLKKLQAEGKKITRLEINHENHILFREAGKLYLVCNLESGFEFPS